MTKVKWNSNTPAKARSWIATHGLQEYGGAVLLQYCTYMGISDQTHYNWLKEHLEYLEAIKEGRRAYKDSIKTEAIEGLRELITGYSVEEKTTEYVEGEDGKPTIKHQVIKQRHIPRNTGAIIFALTNLDPDHWKNRQDTNTKLDTEGLSVIIGGGEGKPARTKEEEE